MALSQQLGAQPLPFPGMDKSGAAVCEFYVSDWQIFGLDGGLEGEGKSSNQSSSLHHLDILLQVRASCQRGASCPYRHVRGDKTIVCKVSTSIIKELIFLNFKTSSVCF